MMTAREGGFTASGRTWPCCGRWLDGGNDCTADAWPKFRVAERVLGLTWVFLNAVKSLEFHVGERRCVQCVCNYKGIGCIHLSWTGFLSQKNPLDPLWFSLYEYSTVASDVRCRVSDKIGLIHFLWLPTRSTSSPYDNSKMFPLHPSTW